MEHISELRSSLNGEFNWNKARMTCFVQMLLGLFAVKTVNLREIAIGCSGAAKIDSRYRRLQRFFALFEIDFVVIARWIFKLFVDGTRQYYLVIDRTNWYWGRQKINVFMLGIAYEGVAIPLFWTLLPKAGSSNFKEQKMLLNQFIDTFGRRDIAGVLADREFAHGQLFGWLNDKNIPFYIRIKEGSEVRIRTKKFSSAKKIFNDLKLKHQKAFPMAVWIFGQKVYLAGARSERGELMIVATNQLPQHAIAIYLRRWEIENLFQCLKSRGFSFEETHMTQGHRVAKLMVLLAIGLAWAHKVGEWKALQKPIGWKKFHQQKRPQYSYFRYGLEQIRDAILHLQQKGSDMKKYIQLLSFSQKIPERL